MQLGQPHNSHNNINMTSISDSELFFGMNKQYAAAILMSLGSSLNSLGYIYVNEHRFHPITTNMIRGIATAIITYLIARKKLIDLTFPSSHNFKWQILRNSAVFITTSVYAWSQFYLPLPIAITLMYTSPIFATIFDRILYGVSINKTQVFWLIVAFGGVLLTSNGNQITQLFDEHSSTSTDSSSFENYFSKDPLVLLGTAFVLILIACLHGFSVVLTKKFINTDSIQINYSQGVEYILLSAIFIPSAFSDSSYHIPTMWESFEALIFMGVPITLGLLAIIYSTLLTTNYGSLLPFMFTAIISGYLVSIFRYGQSINSVCLIGTLAIAIGIIMIARNKERK